MDELKNTKVYLSLIFCFIVLYQLKDTAIFEDKITIITIFVIVPIAIYLFVKYLFYKKG